MRLCESKPEMSEVKVRKKYESDWDTLLGLERHVWVAMYLAQSHFFGLHGLLMIILGQVPRTVLLFTVPWALFAISFGATAVHRYWSHRSFKAKLPLQVSMAFIQTIGAQNHIFQWCRDHRLHHKFTETDADPHDTRRGFWFTHMGWTITKEHPAVKEKEATLDLSDLDNDPIVRFQSRYYFRLFILGHLFMLYVQHRIWPSMSFYQLFCINYIWTLMTSHSTLLINSAAHRWGYRPFDKAFNASDNSLVNLLTVGEGWHNYHHAFPWDYKSSEWGFYSKRWSLIDFLAWTGQAYDLKTVSPKMAAERAKRTGDGSFPQPSGDATLEEGAGAGATVPTWGWGDEDIPSQEYQMTKRLQKNSLSDLKGSG